MFLIFLYAAIVGVAICRPQTSSYLNITTQLEDLDEMSDEELQFLTSFMKIIRDTAMKKDQKLEKVRMMLGKGDAEATKKLLGLVGLAIEYNDWVEDQTKNASPKVKEAISKISDLLCDISFLKKTPAKRVTEIKAIIDSLSDSEKKELEQLDELGNKKAKEMGIELSTQTMKKQH
ncbi:hypothetical protein Aduo_011476 [Ancylostoma duodenale]